MIVGTLRILPAPDRRAEILEVFRTVQGPILAQPGCTACDIYEEQSPERAVVLVERWESHLIERSRKPKATPAGR